MIFGLLLTVTLVIAILFMASQNKTKQKIGSSIIILLGIFIVIPIVAILIFFVTCLGVMALAH